MIILRESEIQSIDTFLCSASQETKQQPLLALLTCKLSTITSVFSFHFFLGFILKFVAASVSMKQKALRNLTFIKLYFAIPAWAVLSQFQGAKILAFNV